MRYDKSEITLIVTSISVEGLKESRKMCSLITDSSSLTLGCHYVALLHVRPSCLIVAIVFLCHTLPCSQQQPQHRERLETFDDVIRSSLEVTERSGKCNWLWFGV